MTTATAEPVTLDQKFKEYHEANPHIYRELVSMCREVKAQGYDKIGIKTVWEALRWKAFFITKDADGWKLNNNYPSRYARLIMQREPDLAGMFDVRELRL